ncbi:MAG: AAA family ATPase [Planctomycetes bacterium]|nr:AAA family ATPase [Planctomycetota bacterium]
MNATLNVELLHQFRQRRAAGASVKSLADELGIPWQRLDKALRHGIAGRVPVPVQAPLPPPKAEPERPIEPERAVLAKPLLQGNGLLAEKYRPIRLQSIFGQPQIVRHLKGFAAAPFPAAYLFSGETGTGKTSAALALAAELGCDMDQKEFGGVQVIASGEQSAEAVRECSERMWLSPMCGSGWKVFILNEAERMHLQAETIWLDRLENIPPRTVIVFTTNHAEKLSQRFRDRCVHLPFESDARRLQESVRVFLQRIWKAETGKTPNAKLIEEIVASSMVAGRLSYRRAVQFLQPHLPPKRESGRKR